MSDEKKPGNASENGDQNQNKAPANEGNAPDKSAPMIPKARFDQVIQQKKDAEAALNEVVESLIEEVPEDKRDLIPDLAPAEKIKWLRKANKAGVFGGQQAASGPDSKRPGGKPPTDFENMTPGQMRAMGYKK